MSPRTDLLILVLGSAAASSKSSNSGSMIRSFMKDSLDMAMALSRLQPGGMSLVGRYQARSTSTAPLIRENKNVWDARKRLIGENKKVWNARKQLIEENKNVWNSRKWLIEENKNARNARKRFKVRL